MNKYADRSWRSYNRVSVSICKSKIGSGIPVCPNPIYPNYHAVFEVRIFFRLHVFLCLLQFLKIVMQSVTTRYYMYQTISIDHSIFKLHLHKLNLKSYKPQLRIKTPTCTKTRQIDSTILNPLISPTKKSTAPRTQSNNGTAALTDLRRFYSHLFGGAPKALKPRVRAANGRSIIGVLTEAADSRISKSIVPRRLWIFARARR